MSVTTYLEAFLLNVLLLIVFLLFIPNLIETNFKHLSSNHKKFIKLASVIIAMISCMVFPFRIGDLIIMDLRTVAVVVGGLYLGRTAIITITVIHAIIRLYFGGLDSGFYAAFISSIIVLIVLLLVLKVFSEATRKKKIIITSILSLFLSTITLLVHSVLFNNIDMLSNSMEIAAYFIIHLFSMILIVYFYEIILESSYLSKRIINAEKLEVVSHLASSISHEVRNPLSVVKGFLQMLKHNDLADNKKNKYIELSLQEIDRANDIIGNYLTFAKPTQDEYVIIDLEQEIKRCIEVITPLANMNCIILETNIKKNYIKGNPQLLQQCLLNITKNCLEAMPNGGNLFITTEEIDNEVVIDITDNGVGMSDEQLRRIGEPFYTTKGREGTGLGMMVVLKIIDLMNGKMTVTSKINKGTQFKVCFPRSYMVNKEK